MEKKYRLKKQAIRLKKAKNGHDFEQIDSVFEVGKVLTVYSTQLVAQNDSNGEPNGVSWVIAETDSGMYFIFNEAEVEEVKEPIKPPNKPTPIYENESKGLNYTRIVIFFSILAVLIYLFFKKQ